MITCPMNGYRKWLQLVPSAHWLYFQVSGRSARIVFSEYHKDVINSYSLLLDGEQNGVVLSRNGVVVKSATKPLLLSPGELNDFWFSWQDGKLQFGAGRYRGQNILIEHDDPDPFPVRAAAVSGTATASAEWKILNEQGGRQFGCSHRQ